MASAKLATLIIRTLAKPISSRIKEQARQHERFRGLCVNLAQFMYRSEVKLRTNILGEPAKHIRPLSEAKAIDNGANALAEGFLFTVAAALIIGETWRSSRNQTKRRDSVDVQLEELGVRLGDLTVRVDGLARQWEEERGEDRQRNDELARILERIVEIGLRGGWAEFQDTPVQLPRVQLVQHPSSSSSSSLSLSSSLFPSSSSSPPYPPTTSPLESSSPSTPPRPSPTPASKAQDPTTPTPEPASAFVSSAPPAPESAARASTTSRPGQGQGLAEGEKALPGSVVSAPRDSAPRPTFRIIVRPRHRHASASASAKRDVKAGSS